MGGTHETRGPRAKDEGGKALLCHGVVLRIRVMASFCASAAPKASAIAGRGWRRARFAAMIA
jgi:hypothetical protein